MALPWILLLIFVSLPWCVQSMSLSAETSTTTQPPAVITARQARSFYRRPLPDSCVALSSRKGRNLFESALQAKGLKVFFPLVEQHSTQTEPAFCGLSTLLVVLNTFAVDPRQTWKGPWRWYDETLLNCCVDLEEVEKKGITLPTFKCLAVCQGLDAVVSYVDEEHSDIESFRAAVQAACIEDGDHDEVEDESISDILVVSYSRKVLGQTGSGHFSPIAAYDAVSDSVLILDTARFKYGSHWVKLPLLYEAMKPVDADTGRSRGYVMLTYHPEQDEHTTPSLPRAVLLRSRMKQNPVRLEFKEYLKNRQSSHQVTWEEVVQYWTKDGTTSKYVWEIVEPQLKSTGADDGTDVLCKEVRALIRELIPSTNSQFPSGGDGCKPNHSRSVTLQPEEALFVVYLACQDKDSREKIVLGSEESSASDETRAQLLAEAELVEIAIEMSDQLAQN